ncbi:carbohydrate ABC transporter permease [Microbacterium aquimaris]|uniref:carbohydrate ABC transporter permease n=1 Tax=Microbacterium aquimaris TaxID=459816 RepID=UPI002AD3E7F3|nr:carbohydrate ABC transporter permease [Microbacterium aquimaris]MDZ8275239.1 carbohydrate ABC transporter permease [Microbacterium aquimaris]
MSRAYASPLNPRKSLPLSAIAGIAVIYTVIPLFWLVVNATKTEDELATTFGLWFGTSFALWDNVVETLTYQDGIFLGWFWNTLVYVVLGAGGATLLAVLAGYALAMYEFRGKKIVLATVLAAVAVPGAALAVPTFLLFSELGITNTPAAVILPSLVAPFSLYLMWALARDAIPVELLEAARIDGAGEGRAFLTVASLLAPGTVTVLLFNVVATWNNYFLPLIMLRNPDLYPLTIGLTSWNNQAATVGGDAVYNLVITGSLLTIIPLIAAFLLLQRYWQAGLAAGSVKG